MNTAQSRPPMIEMSRHRDYVIMLEDLEFAIPRSQLDEITRLHNEGMYFQDIAKEVKRNQYEVIIALLHQVKAGRSMRPFTGRL